VNHLDRENHPLAEPNKGRNHMSKAKRTTILWLVPIALATPLSSAVWCGQQPGSLPPRSSTDFHEPHPHPRTPLQVGTPLAGLGASSHSWMSPTNSFQGVTDVFAE
jgi:hypothetical protein